LAPKRPTLTMPGPISVWPGSTVIAPLAVSLCSFETSSGVVPGASAAAGGAMGPSGAGNLRSAAFAISLKAPAGNCFR
jgi:hypothetical protein